MRVLLDTNVVLMLALDAVQLRPDTVDLLREDRVELVVSAVVPWELAIKYRSGKLPLPEHPRAWVPRTMAEFGAEALPVVAGHAVVVAALPDHHRDPFDRLLVAQAQVERMPIVTADEVFGRYDVEVIPAR